MFNLFKRRNMDSIKQACCDYAAHLGAIAAQGYHDAGEAFAGRIVFDEAKWITVHPNGKGYNDKGEKIKGTPILIDSESGAVLGGAGGKFTGKHISEMPKRGANAIQTQHDIERTRQKNADPEGFAKRQKELIDKRNKQVQAMQAAAEQKKAETERKAKEAQEQQAKEQAAAQERAESQQAQTQTASSSRHAALQKHLQALDANPLPKQFKTNAEAMSWFNKAFPTLDVKHLSTLSPEHARGIAEGAIIIAKKFPILLEHGLKGLVSADAYKREYNKKHAAYNRAHEKQEELVRNDSAEMEKIAAAQQQMDDIWFDQARRYGLSSRGEAKGMDRGTAVKIKNLLHGHLWLGELDENELETLKKLRREGGINYRVAQRAKEMLAEQGTLEPVNETSKIINRCYAYYSCDNQKIWLSPTYFGSNPKENFEESYKRSITPKEKDLAFHPPLKEGISYAAALNVHEMAHSLDNALSSFVSQKWFASEDDDFLKKSFNEFKNKLKKLGKTKDDVYAMTNIQEFVAEHITEALTSPNPSKRAQDVLKRFEQLQEDYMSKG